MKWECELISFKVPLLAYNRAGQGNGKHVCLSRLLTRPDFGLHSRLVIGRPNQTGINLKIHHLFCLVSPPPDVHWARFAPREGQWHDGGVFPLSHPHPKPDLASASPASSWLPERWLKGSASGDKCLSRPEGNAGEDIGTPGHLHIILQRRATPKIGVLLGAVAI
ncbi:hypothetical protein HETIRDRAFT_322544 [Heterobasidion irregulare TC 32-1]|uniref:Uncharacterized protein n=1 Tax=Heterobasidion irregulare (strain TC 32-1) TaxID=747525 RepID=W4K182_HETIT|nr:uncharacterized protein HETIRDRAFT_322544 [Heterobasidion irregulare TC 32-1]ETW79479.1 hypothetical protein HETIRDRAFT_322544 [Heterobasidion irregulare TC 32-1]